MESRLALWALIGSSKRRWSKIVISLSFQVSKLTCQETCQILCKALLGPLAKGDELLGWSLWVCETHSSVQKYRAVGPVHTCVMVCKGNHDTQSEPSHMRPVDPIDFWWYLPSSIAVQINLSNLMNSVMEALNGAIAADVNRALALIFKKIYKLQSWLKCLVLVMSTKMIFNMLYLTRQTPNVCHSVGTEHVHVCFWPQGILCFRLY